MKKEAEIQKFKTEMMDLNYEIRKKEIDMIESRKKSNFSNEEKLTSLKETLQLERNISEELRIQCEKYVFEINKLKEEKKNENNLNHNSFLEKQIATKFKNVNDEIKNLKRKIDGNIEKHIIIKKSSITNNDSPQEQIRQLTQINKNLTSFNLILQSRLQIYVFYKKIFKSNINI